MALVLHKVLNDGVVAHEDFSKESWERAMRDPALANYWGHRPNDCHDPVARRRERLREEGYFDVRDDALVETPEKSPPAPPVDWPPDVPLVPRSLSEMSGLCVDDCKDILSAPKRELPPTAPRPIADKRGQYSLF